MFYTSGTLRRAIELERGDITTPSAARGSHCTLALSRRPASAASHSVVRSDLRRMRIGCVSGARTTTASLGMVTDRAKSQIPGLGYTVTYAVGNTLLTVWGMVLVILLT